ncbi:MAG: hypothetical protein KJ709_02785 [Nanoarchaeota archaeon]|nr:hypothetical protein [Nanoarchaeota archaeon]
MRKIVIVIALISMLLLSGCGTININQKLYRDGTFDLSIEIKSDNEMFTNMVKEGFEESPVIEKATLIEQDDGFKYILEKASFEDVSTESGDSMFESIGIKKEFKFPYYYYTITLKNKGSDDSEYGSMGMSFNYIIEPFGKIIDTNGVYLGEDKKAVKFNLMKSKEYYVTFKDLFISSWFGGASKILNRETKESKISMGTQETDFGNLEDESDLSQDTRLVDSLNEMEDMSVPTKKDSPALSNTEVNAIIKESCAKKWSNDFNMRAYCEEQQIEGYNELMTTSPVGMSSSDFQIIKTLCEDKWETDFNMRAYCEEQQVDGYDELLKTKPAGMSDADFQTIKSECERKWSKDFNMRAYCEDQQVDGWSAVQ